MNRNKEYEVKKTEIELKHETNKLGCSLVILAIVLLWILVYVFSVTFPSLDDHNKAFKLHQRIDVENELQYVSHNLLRITSYNPVIEQCNENPLITADGSFIDTTKESFTGWCAVSRDLLLYYDYGDTITVGIKTDKGYYMSYSLIIHDTGNKRLFKTVDILFLDPKDNISGWGFIIHEKY